MLLEQPAAGVGRVVTLSEPVSFRDLAQRIRLALRLPYCTRLPPISYLF